MCTHQFIQSPGKISGGEILFNPEGEASFDILSIDEGSDRLYELRGGQIAMIFQEPSRSLDPTAQILEQLEEVIPNSELECGFEQEMNMGIIWKVKNCNEGGGTHELLFTKRTFQEVYLFVKPLFFKEEGINQKFYKPFNEIYMSPKGEGAGCYFTIEPFGKNGVRAKGSCGC